MDPFSKPMHHVCSVPSTHSHFMSHSSMTRIEPGKTLVSFPGSCPASYWKLGKLKGLGMRLGRHTTLVLKVVAVLISGINMLQ